MEQEQDAIVISNQEYDELVNLNSQTAEGIKYIVEYLNRQEEKQVIAEKEQAKKAEEQQKKAEEQQKKAEEQQKAQAEEQAKEQTAEQTRETREETQAVTISEVHDMVDLNNSIMSGQIFFMGVIFGLLLMKIIWDRFK